MKQEPDKPLFFQGKWWFVSVDRTYFYYLDPVDGWPNLETARPFDHPGFKEILKRDFGVKFEKFVDDVWTAE